MKRTCNRLEIVTGDRFSSLTTVREVKPTSKGCRRFLFRCDCGNEIEVNIGNVRGKNKTKSCGCVRKAYPTLHYKTHGLTGTTEYNTWLNMKQRCYTASNASFSYYGGRGIKVCERWMDSFEAFLEDMGKRPTPKHLIDRIDVNGDYEPSNCRWVTYVESSSNRRDNIYLEKNGERLTVTAWARKLGLSPRSIVQRMEEGWPEEEWLQPRFHRKRTEYPSKLTKEQVIEIRQRHLNGDSQLSISKDYPVTHAMINHIILRRAWKSV